jgi:hypothetical protein
MSYSKTILLVALIALVSCKKKEEARNLPDAQPVVDGATPPVAADQVQPAVEPPPPNVAARAENSLQTQVDGTVDEFLTSQLQIFIKDKGRLPQSFTEFVRTRLDSIPPPPTGLKWAIDASSKEVKAVRRP